MDTSVRIGGGCTRLLGLLDAGRSAPGCLGCDLDPGCSAAGMDGVGAETETGITTGATAVGRFGTFGTGSVVGGICSIGALELAIRVAVPGTTTSDFLRISRALSPLDSGSSAAARAWETDGG